MKTTTPSVFGCRFVVMCVHVHVMTLWTVQTFPEEKLPVCWAVVITFNCDWHDCFGAMTAAMREYLIITTLADLYSPSLGPFACRAATQTWTKITGSHEDAHAVRAPATLRLLLHLRGQNRALVYLQPLIFSSLSHLISSVNCQQPFPDTRVKQIMYSSVYYDNLLSSLSLISCVCLSCLLFSAGAWLLHTEQKQRISPAWPFTFHAGCLHANHMLFTLMHSVYMLARH